jgi:hypothetical protein
MLLVSVIVICCLLLRAVCRLGHFVVLTLFRLLVQKYNHSGIYRLAAVHGDLITVFGYLS